jgi:hypothetical protein
MSDPTTADVKLADANAKLAEADAKLAEADAKLAAADAKLAAATAVPQLQPQPQPQLQPQLQPGFKPIRLEGNTFPGAPELPRHGCACHLSYTTTIEFMLEVQQSLDGSYWTTGRQTIVFPKPTANLIQQPGFMNSPPDMTPGIILIPCEYRGVAQLQWKGEAFGYVQTYQPIGIVPQQVHMGQPAVVWPRMQAPVGELEDNTELEHEDNAEDSAEDNTEDSAELEHEHEHELEHESEREHESELEREHESELEREGEDKLKNKREDELKLTPSVVKLTIETKTTTTGLARAPSPITPLSYQRIIKSLSLSVPHVGLRALAPTPTRAQTLAVTPKATAVAARAAQSSPGPTCICGDCKTCINRATRGSRGGKREQAKKLRQYGVDY